MARRRRAPLARDDVAPLAGPLADSYRESLSIARDLRDFCTRLGQPFGFHVESVSIRKAEIDAAIRLTADLGALLRS